MRTIWLVWKGEYSGAEVIAAFSEEPTAQEYSDKIYESYIEYIVLDPDEAIEFLAKPIWWNAYFGHDGNLRALTPIDEDDDSDNCLGGEDLGLQPWSCNRYRVALQARTKDIAKKEAPMALARWLLANRTIKSKPVAETKNLKWEDMPVFSGKKEEK